jgi:hypothetical protein
MLHSFDIFFAQKISMVTDKVIFVKRFTKTIIYYPNFRFM